MTFPTEWKVIKFHGSSHHQPENHHKTSDKHLAPWVLAQEAPCSDAVVPGWLDVLFVGRMQLRSPLRT